MGGAYGPESVMRAEGGSACFGPETLQSHPQRQIDEETGGKRDTSDLLSCSHRVLQGLAAGGGAGGVPHDDAADQVNRASKGVHYGGRGSCSSQFSQKIELLLGFSGW